MLASCSYALPLARTILVVHVCATAHLPNVVLVGACGPTLSELVASTENHNVYTFIIKTKVYMDKSTEFPYGLNIFYSLRIYKNLQFANCVSFQGKPRIVCKP